MSEKQSGGAAHEGKSARLQLPSLNWQRDWQPTGLERRLERNFPPLFKAEKGLRESEQQQLRQMVAAMQNCLALQLTPE